MGFNSSWDGSLSLTSSHEDDLCPNDEHIERAAAFLAGLKLGRLQYAQVLGYFAHPELVQEDYAFESMNSPLS